MNDNADLQRPADTRQQRNRLLLLALCGIAPLMVNELVNSVIAHNALLYLVHWENGLANLASTYIVGVFMAIAYLGLRNLWPLVIGHIFTDLVWFGKCVVNSGVVDPVSRTSPWR